MIFALMTGEANTRLTQRKVGEQGQASKERWSVRGFFAKPGGRVETEKKGQVRQAVYLPSWQVRPDVYRYRLGSPVEARTSLYQGPFKNEAEAQFDNPISQAWKSHQAQVLAAQSYLDQARQQKTGQHLDVGCSENGLLEYKKIS